MQTTVQIRATLLGLLLYAAPSLAQVVAPPAQAPSTEEPPAAADLEAPKPNQGHFLGIGLYGVGATAWDQARGTRSPTLGEGFSVRLGESVTSWLDLSIAFAWATTQGKPQDRFSFGRLGVQSQWYFHPAWFVPAGFGATSATGTDPADHDLVRSRYGAVFWTGVGTNIPLTNRSNTGGWVLTPVLTVELAPEARFTSTALWLGLELSWWAGLPPNKLKLPAVDAYRAPKR